MRFGTAGRIAVLASLALLVSAQLCMLTTCLPRLDHAKAQSGAHACCRATGAVPVHGASKAPVPAGAMPCDMMARAVSAPDAGAPAPLPTVVLVDDVCMMAPPARDEVPVADHGPPLDRLLPAPAGERAPPQLA